MFIKIDQLISSKVETTPLESANCDVMIKSSTHCNGQQTTQAGSCFLFWVASGVE